MNIHISNDVAELLKVDLVLIFLKFYDNFILQHSWILVQLTLSYIKIVLSTICWS